MLRVPNADTPEGLTDWLEASLLTGQGANRIADADLQDALQEAGRNREEDLELILQQFRQRHQILGENYPFQRAGSGFQARNTWDQHLCYSFLLFVSLNQIYPELNHGGAAREPAILFELITARALELFLDAQSVRIGAPREAPVPGGFPASVAYLAGFLQEPQGNGGLEKHGSGDDGLDIWAMKRFGDERTSSLFVIAQCAIGTDWDLKRSELDLELWKRHIDWFTVPLKAFAVPFQINQGSWRETATRGGLVLDRIRLAMTARAADLPNPVVRRLERWTRTRVQRTSRSVAA